MRRAAAVLLFLLAMPASAQSVATIRFDPAVVRPDRTDPVLLTVTMNGTVATARLQLSDTESIPLVADPSGNWTVEVPIEDVLKGYDPSDAGRRLVGFVKLYASSTRLIATQNAFISVLDDTMPRVAIGTVDPATRISPRIINVQMTADLAARSRESVGQKLYRYLADDYDFVNIVFAHPSLASNPVHYVIRNRVQGIGLPLLDNGAAYGSLDRLIGVNLFPLDTTFDMGDTAATHELGHQWINYLQMQQLLPGPHWPLSSMAHHVMGFNVAGSTAGSDWPWRLDRDANGTHRYFAEPARDDFSDLDLYLMGFIPPSQVQPQLVVTSDAPPCNGCPAAVTSLTVDQVVAASGPRVPSSATARKSFRVATIVVTRDRVLSDDELTLFDYFASRGEATTLLQSNSTLAGKTAVRPFFLATRGLGLLNTKLTFPNPIVFVESVTPSRLPLSGGEVTVSGSGFSNLTTVSVGGRTVANVTIVDTHTLRFIAPGAAPNGGELIVTTTGKGTVRVPGAITWGARRRAVAP